MLTVNDLTQNFGAQLLFENVNASFHQGDVTASLVPMVVGNPPS